MPDLKKTLGYRYLQDTKYDRHDISSYQMPVINHTSSFKEYPDAEKVPLQRSGDHAGDDLWKVLQERRSVRNYTAENFSRTELSLLLWASQGLTAQAGKYFLRTAPSAGGLYPIETYVAVQHVEDVAPGLYHFDVRGFQLERLTSEAPGEFIAHAALDQIFISEGSATFIWSAIMRRNMCKYGHRAMRYICMDAGHICQNLLLAAEALNLKACPIAAFYDDELNYLLELDGEEESVLYLAAVGK